MTTQATPGLLQVHQLVTSIIRQAAPQDLQDATNPDVASTQARTSP